MVVRGPHRVLRRHVRLRDSIRRREATVTDTDRMIVWLRQAMDAAQQRAEAAANETGSADWEYRDDFRIYATSPPGFMVADVDYRDPAPGTFMADNDPATVRRRITADRKMLDDLLADGHDRNIEDAWYSCGSLTDPDTEGSCLDETRHGKCDCGRDTHVERRVRLLAEAWGWSEGTT
jgi:hypothetical protein